MIYETEDGTRVAARPSGTEPKVKFYISTNAKLDKAEDFQKVNAELDTKARQCADRLGLAFERRATGYGDLSLAMESLADN